jgi:hypothetical protein
LSFTGYDGQWLICTQSAAAAVLWYQNSVNLWLAAQGPWMRTHSGSARGAF